MNNHPEELLAAYVEGTLGADERASVDAHLATCDRCTEEVELAGEARTALAGLSELEPPAGIPLAVRRQARPAISPKVLRVAGIAVAASVLAAGVIYGISNIDLGAGGGAESSAPAAQGEAPEAPRPEDAGGGAGEADTATTSEAAADLRAAPALPTYLESRRDYDSDDLAPLARRLRDEALGALDAGVQRTAKTFFETFDPAAFTVPVRQAIRCVLAEVPPEQLVVPFRIEAASFEGEPAYVAAFLQGPTPDEPYDRLVIWVVDREGCSLLSLASQLL
jgi:hypothetical protein